MNIPTINEIALAIVLLIVILPIAIWAVKPFWDSADDTNSNDNS